jgi:hypothetical protein
MGKYLVSRTGDFFIQCLLFLGAAVWIWSHGEIHSLRGVDAYGPWYGYFWLYGIRWTIYSDLVVVTILLCCSTFVIVRLLLYYYEKDAPLWGGWVMLFWIYFFLILAMTYPPVDY